MARQEDSCWRCGTQWIPEGQPVLRLIPGDEDDFASEVTLPLPATAATR